MTSVISAQEERTAKLGPKGLIRVAARPQNKNDLFSPRKESIFKRKIHDIIIDRCDSQASIENIPPNNQKKVPTKNKVDVQQPKTVTLWRRKSGFLDDGSVSSVTKGIRERSTNNNTDQESTVLSARISVMSEQPRSVTTTTQPSSQRGYQSHILVKKTHTPSIVLDSASVVSTDPSKARLVSRSVDHSDKLHNHHPSIIQPVRATFDSVLHAMKKHGQLLGPVILPHTHPLLPQPEIRKEGCTGLPTHSHHPSSSSTKSTAAPSTNTSPRSGETGTGGTKSGSVGPRNVQVVANGRTTNAAKRSQRNSFDTQQSHHSNVSSLTANTVSTTTIITRPSSSLHVQVPSNVSSKEQGKKTNSKDGKTGHSPHTPTPPKPTRARRFSIMTSPVLKEPSTTPGTVTLVSQSEKISKPSSSSSSMNSNNDNNIDDVLISDYNSNNITTTNHNNNNSSSNNDSDSHSVGRQRRSSAPSVTISYSNKSTDDDPLTTTSMIGLDAYTRSLEDLHHGVKKVRYHHGRTDGDEDDGDDRSVQSHVELFLPPTSSHTPLSPPPARFVEGDIHLVGVGDAVGVRPMGTSESSLDGVDAMDSCDQIDDMNEAQPRQQKLTRALSRRGSLNTLETVPCLLGEKTISERAITNHRRRSTVQANREQYIKEIELAAQEAYQRKQQRKEEKQKIMELETRRKMWLKIIAIARCQAFLIDRIPMYLARARDLRLKEKASQIIARFYRRWMWMRLAKLQLRFLKDFEHTKPFWTKLARWWKRRASAIRITNFLVACSKCSVYGFSPIFVRRYLQKVRLVQGHIRSFLLCKRARVEALMIKWEKAEMSFIKSMVQEAEARKRRGLIAGSSVAGSMIKWQNRSGVKQPSSLASAVAAAAIAEIKARKDATRVSKWSSIESKVEALVSRTEGGGKLDSDGIVRYLVDRDLVVRPIVEIWLKDARKVVMHDYSEEIRKRFAEMKVVPSYTTHDAKRLLQGDERGVLEALTRKLELAACPVEKKKARMSVKRKPFFLYKKFNMSMLEQAVKRAHQDLRNEVRERRLAFVSDDKESYQSLARFNSNNVGDLNNSQKSSNNRPRTRVTYASTGLCNNPLI